MSKLQRTIDGQTLAFVTLPRIFQSLSVDSPSGSIRLKHVNDHAYWRLTRNLGDLKKHGVTVRDCATHLAKALKAMSESEAFMNHYGLVRPPEISNEANMTKLFVNLLQLNTNRVEQSSVFYDRSKPLVESIVIPLGHQVQLTATRGLTRPPHGGGLKGSIWLKSEDHVNNVNHFVFNISSPIVNLGERLHPDRLQKEIITKLRQNMPTQVDNPIVEFDEGQFDDFLGNGLKALVEKTAHAPNGNSKKKGALVKPVPTINGEPISLEPVDPEMLKKFRQDHADHAVKHLMSEAIAHQPQLAERLVNEVTASRSGSATIYPEKIIDVKLDRSTGNLVVTVNDVHAAETAAQVAEAISDAIVADIPLSVTTDEEGTEYLGVTEVVAAAAKVSELSDQSTQEVLLEAIPSLEIKPKEDRDVELILFKIRQQVADDKVTKSAVVPTMLSPMQKSAVRDAFISEGAGAVWFYDVIGGNTAVVLQWDVTEGEPHVDINGDLKTAAPVSNHGDFIEPQPLTNEYGVLD